MPSIHISLVVLVLLIARQRSQLNNVLRPYRGARLIQRRRTIVDLLAEVERPPKHSLLSRIRNDHADHGAPATRIPPLLFKLSVPLDSWIFARNGVLVDILPVEILICPGTRQCLAGLCCVWWEAGQDVFIVGAAHKVCHVEECRGCCCWVGDHVVRESCAGMAEEGSEQGGDALGQREHIVVGWVGNAAHSGISL